MQVDEIELAVTCAICGNRCLKEPCSPKSCREVHGKGRPHEHFRCNSKHPSVPVIAVMTIGAEA